MNVSVICCFKSMFKEKEILNFLCIEINILVHCIMKDTVNNSFFSRLIKAVVIDMFGCSQKTCQLKTGDIAWNLIYEEWMFLPIWYCCVYTLGVSMVPKSNFDICSYLYRSCFIPCFYRICLWVNSSSFIICWMMLVLFIGWGYIP